jgi:hypothetical protein
MTDQDILESIPCGNDGLPLGYAVVRSTGGSMLLYRGTPIYHSPISDTSYHENAWDDALEREKSRLASQDRAKKIEDSAWTRAINTLTDVTNERNALSKKLSKVSKERDELYKGLNKIRELSRWDKTPYSSGPDWASGGCMKRREDGDWVRWSDIEKELGELWRRGNE